MDSGLAAAATQQHNDRNATQQTLQLILQQLQHRPVTNPAPVQAKTEPEEPTGSPKAAVTGTAPNSNLPAVAPGLSHDGSPATTAPPGHGPGGSSDTAAPPGSEPVWGPAPDDSLDFKGSGKGKDDSGRPAPY